jgi:hypothetical protein
MGQILHGSATTTEVIRQAIQHRQESLRTLSKRCGINQKTVAKWKKPSSTADLKTGPKEPMSTILSVKDEAIIVAFRRHGVIVARLMSDNGSAHRSPAFRLLLAARGIRHNRTRTYTPQTNGKAKRFIQTSLREWA